MTRPARRLPWRGRPLWPGRSGPTPIAMGAIALILGLGCACPTPPHAAPPVARPLGPDLPVRAAATGPSASSGPLETDLPLPLPLPLPDEGASSPSPVPGSLSLEQALAQALLLSPRLAAFSWEIRAREARAVQAGLRPNTSLTLEVEDFGGTGEAGGFDGSESTLLLSQRIETADKRSKRRQAALLDATVAELEYETARITLLSSVRRAFFRLLAAQERVELVQELVVVAESSANEVERLVSAGAVPRAERTRARVEQATARIELASSRRAQQAARAELAETWGGHAPTFERAQGELGRVSAPPDALTLRSWLEQRNPELEHWSREVARREALVELEDARAVPDVVAGAGLRRLEASDDTAFVVDVGMELPLSDRNQGSREAARSDRIKAELERRAAYARLGAALGVAEQELRGRLDEVTSLRDEILPSAQQAFEEVRRAYAQGLFRAVDVFDAQRRLFELRLREIDALEAYHFARAEIEELTATPLDASGTTDDGGATQP